MKRYQVFLALILVIMGASYLLSELTSPFFNQISSPDNTHDLGQPTDKRPRNIYVGTSINASGTMRVDGLATFTDVITASATRYTGMSRITAYQTTICPIYNSVGQIATFSNELEDTLDEFTPSTGIFLTKSGGHFLFIFTGEWETNANGYRVSSYLVNNDYPTPWRYFQVPGTSAGENVGPTHSTIFKLAKGDNVKIQLYQNSGATLNLSVNGFQSLEIFQLDQNQ